MLRKLRFLLPVGAALVLAAGIIGVLSWQMNLSAEQLRAQLGRLDFPIPMAADITPIPFVTADAGDAALLALRRGDLLVLQEDTRGAKAAYQEAVDHGGGVMALKKLALVALQRGEFAEVEKAISILQTSGMPAEDISLLRAVLLLHTGKATEVPALFADTANSPQKHYALALKAIIENTHDTAKAELTMVVEGFDAELRMLARTLLDAYLSYGNFPQSSTAHLDTLLARALALTGQCRLGVPLAESATRAQPDYRDAWIILGVCQLKTEQPLEAQKSLQRAYEIDPEKAETQYYLALAYAATADYQNAITFIQYALENGLQPAKGGHEALARFYADIGQSANEFEQRKIIAESTDALPDDVLVFAEAAVAQNRIPESIQTIQSAITRWPDHVALYLLMGRLSELQGSHSTARQFYQKALELDPANPEAKRALNSLR